MTDEQKTDETVHESDESVHVLDENVHETAESGDGQIAGQNVQLVVHEGVHDEAAISHVEDEPLKPTDETVWVVQNPDGTLSAMPLEQAVMAGVWQPSLHEPMWGISDGKPHEFVMRQGGIISMKHKTDPDWFNEHVLQMQAGAKPIDDAGIYAPTKALIEKVISAKYPETR